MPFIPAADCARFTIHQLLHGEQVSNTIYARKTGGFGEDDLTSTCLLLRNWILDEYAEELSINWSATRIVARAMHTEEAVGIEYVAGLPLTGGIVSQGAPGNVTLAIKLKTGLTGRNRSGRIFVAGLAEDDTEGNTLDATRVTALQDDWNTLIQSMITNGVPMVICSFYDGTTLELQPNGETRRVPVPRAAALVTPVINASADNQLDSMKRRLAGRGR